MGFRVEITTAVRQDILDGINYYQAISEKLSEAFCKDIFLSLDAIENNPTFFSYYHEPFRRVLLKKFPYLIIYKIYGDIVIITGVFFAKQNPEIIKSRSKD